MWENESDSLIFSSLNANKQKKNGQQNSNYHLNDIGIPKLKLEIQELSKNDINFENITSKIRITQQKIAELEKLMSNQFIINKQKREKVLQETAYLKARLNSLNRQFNDVNEQLGLLKTENLTLVQILENSKKTHNDVNCGLGQTQELLSSTQLRANEMRFNNDKDGREQKELTLKLAQSHQKLQLHLQIVERKKQEIQTKENQLEAIKQVAAKLVTENHKMENVNTQIVQDVFTMDDQSVRKTEHYSQTVKCVQFTQMQTQEIKNQIFLLKGKLERKQSQIQQNLAKKFALEKVTLKEVDTLQTKNGELELLLKSENFKNDEFQTFDNEKERLKTKKKELEVFASLAFCEMEKFVKTDNCLRNISSQERTLTDRSNICG